MERNEVWPVERLHSAEHLRPVERLRSECVCCVMKNYLEKVPEGTSEEQKLDFMQRLFGILSAAPRTVSAPVIVREIVRLQKELLSVVNQADVILSKGQGDYETLRGCGRNIFYLFLCKCDMFAKEFGVPKMTGMLVREK